MLDLELFAFLLPFDIERMVDRGQRAVRGLHGGSFVRARRPDQHAPEHRRLPPTPLPLDHTGVADRSGGPGDGGDRDIVRRRFRDGGECADDLSPALRQRIVAQFRRRKIAAAQKQVQVDRIPIARRGLLLLLARFARRTLTGVIIMAITGAAAVAMIIGMIRAAEVVLGRMPVVDRTRLSRVLESVVEAPLDLVVMALVRARIRGHGFKQGRERALSIELARRRQPADAIDNLADRAVASPWRRRGERRASPIQGLLSPRARLTLERLRLAPARAQAAFSAAPRAIAAPP